MFCWDLFISVTHSKLILPIHLYQLIITLVFLFVAYLQHFACFIVFHNMIISVHKQNINIVNFLLLEDCKMVVVFAVVVTRYGCESWTISHSLEKKIVYFELKYYRKVIRIPWPRKVKNDDILQSKHWWKLAHSIMIWLLKYFGHVTHHSGLERIVLEGIIHGSALRWT